MMGTATLVHEPERRVAVYRLDPPFGPHTRVRLEHGWREVHVTDVADSIVISTIETPRFKDALLQLGYQVVEA